MLSDVADPFPKRVGKALGYRPVFFVTTGIDPLPQDCRDLCDHALGSEGVRASARVSPDEDATKTACCTIKCGQVVTTLS